jgi:hypothetical protein
MGSGGTSGIITDYLKAFRLVNLKSVVVGGACGAPDRGGISKNGTNK